MIDRFKNKLKLSEVEKSVSSIRNQAGPLCCTPRIWINNTSTEGDIFSRNKCFTILTSFKNVFTLGMRIKKNIESFANNLIKRAK